MKDFLIRFDAPIKIFLILAISLIGGFLVFNFRPKDGKVFIREQPLEFVDRCGEDCEKRINEIVSGAIATLSAKTTTKTSEAPKTSSTPTKLTTQGAKVQYVPIGGAGSTTKTDWADLLNTDFFFDIGEYGKVKSITWSATLKIMHGNGQTFARIFDVTNGIAVTGSEISVTSDKFTLVEGGQLNFFSGKNHYRVQVKSLNSFEAFFDSGRIKIVTD